LFCLFGFNHFCRIPACGFPYAPTYAQGNNKYETDQKNRINPGAYLCLYHIILQPGLHDEVTDRQGDACCQAKQQHILLKEHAYNHSGSSTIYFADGYFSPALFAVEGYQGENTEHRDEDADYRNEVEQLDQGIFRLEEFVILFFGAV